MADHKTRDGVKFRKLSPAFEARMAQYGEALFRDGAVCIPKALDAENLKICEALFAWTRSHPGQTAQDVAITEKGETIYIDTYSNIARDHYREVLQHSNIPAIMAAVLDVDRLWYLGEQILEKAGEPGTRPTPWHQDTDMPINQTGTVGMWMSFEPLDHGHALDFVRYSNRWPRLNPFLPPEPNGRVPLLYPFDDARHLAPFPNLDAEPGKFEFLRWPTEPGDVVLFHNMTIHGGGRVPPSGLRRALCLRFFGPETRFEALPQRRETGNLAAEATQFLWEGLAEGQPLHQGKAFFEVYDNSKALRC